MKESPGPRQHLVLQSEGWYKDAKQSWGEETNHYSVLAPPSYTYSVLAPHSYSYTETQSWQVIRSWMCSPHEWDWCLHGRDPRGLLCPLLPCEDKERRILLWNRPSPGSKSGALVPDFPASSLWRISTVYKPSVHGLHHIDPSGLRH